ncbi:homeobox protein dve-1 isoform X2 [Culicoides brevitarsis]|uniref:homeobox protein dve-1 isoform X2 n=1 Tax=Culicoides brevitarsis TaxID=469753 RepID=UPI00307C9F88
MCSSSFRTHALSLAKSKSPSQNEQSGSPIHPSSSVHSERSSSNKQESPKNNVNMMQNSTHSVLTSNVTEDSHREAKESIYDRSTQLTSKLGLNMSETSDGNIVARENGLMNKSVSSPIIDQKDFDINKVHNAKSLPLHCVVESIGSMNASILNEARHPWKRRPSIETDSYVIIPSQTPFSDIVTTALQRLGYSIDIMNTARGSIIVKNWKAIALEKITDNPLVSVFDILGELISVVTLKITIIRSKPSQLMEVKDKLLKLLILQSHAVLRSSGCPLDEITLSQICRSPIHSSFPFNQEISEELKRKFDQWWGNQLTPQSNPISHKILPFSNPNQTTELDFVNSGTHSRDVDNRHPASLIVHPALQTVHSQYPNQKTRMRTSFDPEMELPKLQRWFQENPHPSRQQIQSYVVQLNALESRRGRKPLDVNNVVYWFKNARAAQKRAEMRGQSGILNGFSPSAMMLQQSEYNIKSSPSNPPSEDIDAISQHSDDEVDDSERAGSPQLPLSLTMHERHRSPISNISVKREETISPNVDDATKVESKNNNNNGSTCDRSPELNDDEDSLSKNDRPLSPSARSIQSDDLDVDDQDHHNLDDFRTPSPDSSRRNLSFPLVGNSVFSQSIMYMSHYMPQIPGSHHQNGPPAGIGSVGINLSNSFSNDERRKRNRTFIDPVTEVPKLEQWFSMNTHPSHNLILKYTEDLNRMPYRQKFPRLESKNVQFWFKNRRAKCKRLKMSLYDSSQLSGLNPFHHSERE